MVKLIILITAISLQVSAAMYAQKITLSVKDKPLREVMQDIRKQSRYNFFFESDFLKNAKPITVNLNQASIEQTLQIIFADQSLNYQIEGKIVMLTSKVAEKKSPITSPPDQQKNISGTVKDEQGNPLPGVTVILKDPNNRITVTDSEGRFSFLDAPDQGTIIVRMIGRGTKEIKYKNGNALSFVLKEINTDLEVTVIKGYYNTTKELNTGSVGTLKAVDIAKQPVSDPLMALEGRIAGLYISQTSGVPGAAMKVRLRGQNSISNGNDPLYIIDGIPFNSSSLSQAINAAGYAALSPFTNIRPDDIERIEVLKDADATAIYGSRGANGVILITTKKGKAGKTKLDVNVFQGTGKITRTLKLLNTQQYLEMRNEAFANDGETPQSYNYDVNGAWNQSRYTDWQKVMIGNTSNITDAKATLSGGTELTQFLIGLGYRRETTVFPGDFLNKIGSTDINITHRSENNKFFVNLSSKYANNTNHLPQTDFSQFIYMAPNAPAIYDANGQLNWENNTFRNPFANLLRKSNSITESLINNLELSYNLTKSLQFKTNFGYSTSKINELSLTPFSSMLPSLSSPQLRRNSSTNFNDNKSWIIEPQINYSRTFNNHHIDVLIGSTFQENKLTGLAQSATGFSSDALLENIGTATKVTSTTSYTQYRYNAIYARIGYNYLEKYVLNLTGRRDGSSRFGPGKQFGDFGSVGAAWIFFKEHGVTDALPFLSYGKLRGSVGRTGNDQLPDYEYLSTYGPNTGYFGTSGLSPFKLTNPFFGWETINKMEVALELGFINNHILVNTSFYRHQTSNQLVGYSLPLLTGFNSIRANLPAIVRNTGLEIDISTTNVQYKNFTWNSSFNLTVPKNKLVSYPNIESSAYATVYTVGKPLNTGFSYKYAGLDPSTGLYTFKDINKDGQVDVQDRVSVFRGQKYYGGLSNSFSYKGLSLDIFFQYVKQTGFKFISNGLPGSGSALGANQPISVLDRWSKTGDIATYQKFSQSNEDAYNANDQFANTDNRIVDASFIRLKNVSFSWTLPESWSSKLTLRNLRLYFQAQNLLTITKFKGSDPETQSSTLPSLPPLRILTTGIQVNF